MGSGVGGSGRGGGTSGLPRLQPGFRYGPSIEASAQNLRPGDVFSVRTPRLSAGGEITRVNRTTIDYKVQSYVGEVNIRTRISNLSGGFVQRGNVITPVR